MITTLDNKQMYEKHEVDQIAQEIRNASTSADELAALDNKKVNKSDLPDEVNRAVDAIITSKVETVVSDINHIVNNAVGDALNNYDNGNTVDQKIATATNDMATQAFVSEAIAQIPNPGVASSADVTAIVNQYF